MQNAVYINKGTTQDDRLPELLLPENVQIDGRDSTQLLAFLSDFSRLLNYYSLNANQKLMRDGDWRFFSKHPIFILAKIASADFRKIVARFHLSAEVLGKSTESLVNKTYAMRLLFEIFGDLVDRTNAWSEDYEDMPLLYRQEYLSVLDNTISPLFGKVRAANEYYLKLALVEYPFFDWKKVSATLNPTLWPHLPGQKSVSEELSILEKRTAGANAAATGTNLEASVNTTYDYVLGLVQDFFNALNQLVRQATVFLQKEINERSDVRPDVALVTTFVSLFGSARQSLNANTGRHLDFYYNDVLRLKPADFVADTAYVSFQLSPNVSSFPLDAGVQLDAGKDAKGVPIVFTTLQGANLCQIQVADVKNFSISRNPLIQPGTKELLITGIYTADNPAVPTDATWPVFGEDQVAYGDDQRTMQDAVLGFAFASKVLFMNSGNRSIQLNLFFTSESFQSCLMDLLTEIATINQQGHPSASLDAAVTTIFERVFCNGFRVDVTGKKNWLSLTVAQVTFDASAASISLFLDVPEGADPITAYDPKLHGAGYSTDYPLLRCLLVNQSPYAIYNFLNGLILKNACIEVNVTGCKDLVLYNQYGRIDSSKPFQPFGNQPERGTYFLLGNNEVFIKDSLSVKLYLEWINLPEEGFAEYYQEYGIEVTNTSYQVQFSYLRDSGWQQPRSMKSPFSLFTEVSTDSPTGPVTSLAEISEYDMEVPPETLLSAGISPDDLTIPLTYDQNTANGFFRMQLTAPSFGFGASLYNNVLSQTILNNTINKESNPLPNPPYTPMAGSVSMDYYAKDDVSFVTASHEREGMFDFYHIDAFTQYPITASATPSSYDDGLADTGRISNVQGSYKALLPSYASNGYLYLGLSNVTQAEPLSVLFYFTQKESGETANLPAVQWSYLLDNQWQLFQEGNTLHDETYSFSQSGIITFDLPQPDASVNTLMPPGLFWLRAEVPGNIDLFGDVSGIYAQVMKASYAPDYSNLAQRDSLVLPAGTIKRTIQNIPQIKSVSQPFSSFGGVLPETRNAFYTRISERLHHKHRAINAWDFERIALQAFPGIYKVKAFSNSSVSPGSDNRKVEIMVIPYMDANGTATTDIYAPVFGFMMLEQIKNYLQQYASPHLHINIRNPVYERLMVRCQVMFDNSSPFYIQKLNDDIAAYLSPWIDDNKRSVNSGDSIQKSSILGYIQQLDYVEFVTAFSIVKITNVDGAYDFYDTANDPYNSDLLYALTPWSVFVSAEQHLIDSIDVMKYEDPQPTGINDLTIGSDFIVVADKEPPPPSSPILLKSSGPPAAAPTPQQQSPRYLI